MSDGGCFAKYLQTKEAVMDFQKGFVLDFDMKTGLSNNAQSTKRTLSQMKGMYADEAALQRMVAGGDPLIYEFYELGAPDHAGDIASGTSVLYPGKVGAEYFMTKGHFHTIVDTAEAYYCLAGEGYMLTENAAGDWAAHKLYPGAMLYVPKGYAHRSVNTGAVPLVTFFAFRGDAGHDYGTIEEKGFRKLIVERDAKAVVIDNPKWG